MGIRTLFYFSFFISSTAYAVAISNTADIVPSVIVKPIKRVHTFTSGPKTIITREQINTAGITTLAQALQNLAGVQLQDMLGNGSQASVSLRGFGDNATSNTLFLVNGIPLTNPDLAAPNLNTIPLYAIETIEVIAGSESVLYGDQAVGGVINIILRESANEKAELACNAGSYNARGCYATIFNNFNDLKFNVAVSNNNTDNYREHNQYEQNFLLARLNYPYPTGSLNFDVNLGIEDMQYPGSLTAAQVRQNRHQSNNNTDFFKNSSGLFHLKNSQSLSTNWQLETDLVQRQMHGHGVLSSRFTQSRMIYFIKPQLKGNFGNAAIRTGIDAQNDSYRLNSLFGLNENDQQKYSLFTVAKYTYSPQIKFTAGVRGAQQNSQLTSFGTNHSVNRALATTLGASFQVCDNTNFYVRRAESFRFPKADENASTPLGIKSLRTQRGVSYESGVEVSQDPYTGKLNIYQLNLRDEIAFDPTQTPQQPFGANRNLAPTVRRGLTLSGKYIFNPAVTLNGQYNYVNARFQQGINSGNRIPLVAENILRAGVDFHLAIDWRMYLEAIYTGNQFPANDDANVSGKIGGYTIYNFNLRYKHNNIEAALHLNNIFNKEYYLYTVYSTFTNTQSFYPAPERNVLLTLKYLFL